MRLLMRTACCGLADRRLAHSAFPDPVRLPRSQTLTRTYRILTSSPRASGDVTDAEAEQLT